MIAPVTGDPRFFAQSGPHGWHEVARAACGEGADPGADDPGAHDPGAHDIVLTGIAPLQIAGPGEVSFLDNRRYAAVLEATRAGAVIVHPEMADRVPAGTRKLVTADPYVGWARVAALFHPPPPLRPGIHPSAVVGSDAEIDATAEIGPLAVIGDGAVIGPRCRIAAQAVIGDGVILGADCRIGSHASLSHAILGMRVYVYPGARIGQEGFGFATTAAGFLTVPQLGRVILQDDVEIGANSTVDRGSARDTILGAGTRLDNLVQIGHNVQTGRCCVIVALAGLSGSVVLDDFVTIAGQVGVAGHLHVGTRARVGAQAGVINDVPAGADMIGSPAQPVAAFFRQVALLRRLARRDTRPAGGAGAGGNQPESAKNPDRIPD